MLIWSGEWCHKLQQCSESYSSVKVEQYFTVLKLMIIFLFEYFHAGNFDNFVWSNFSLCNNTNKIIFKINELSIFNMKGTTILDVRICSGLDLESLDKMLSVENDFKQKIERGIRWKRRDEGPRKQRWNKKVCRMIKLSIWK